MTATIRDMSRTAVALAAYDKADVKFGDGCGLTQADWLDQFAALEDLAEAVGVAFGLDTADINNQETCRRHVRPGPKEPGPGFELSFVRRMVAKWEASR